MGQNSINIPVPGAPSASKEEKERYNRPISFGARTLAFEGNVLLRQNISHIDRYRIPPGCKLSVTGLILVFLVMVVSLSLWVEVPVLISLMVLVPGSIERSMRKSEHRLTIEMNAGYRKIFLSKDIHGINDLFQQVQDALKNGKELEAFLIPGSIDSLCRPG